MKTTYNFLLLPMLSFTIFFNGCSSHQELVSVSETHLYDTNYGLDSNVHVDAIIHNELMAMNSPTEVELPQYSEPEWTSELRKEEGTFLAEDYVPTEPVITYKYKFDKKFYDTATWRKAEF
jgi:hypothetical protein